MWLHWTIYMLNSSDRVILGNLEFCQPFVYIFLSLILIQLPSYIVYSISLEVFWGRTQFRILKCVEHPEIALASSRDTTESHCKLVSVFFSAFAALSHCYLLKYVSVECFSRITFPLGYIHWHFKNYCFHFLFLWM